MSQKLILPIHKCKVTASWKTDAYKNKFGFNHYGMDMVSTAGNTNLTASGNGTVVGIGVDNVVGNVLIIQYPEVYHKPSRKYMDVVFRYYHLASIQVKTGQSICTGSIIAKYGNTGMLKMPLHLHMEADSDTKAFNYSPTVRNGSYIKGTASGATDKTMFGAGDFLHTCTSAPYSQTYTTTGDSFIREEDKKTTFITL